MPLFRRADGQLIRDVAPVRAMMPFIMPGRTESVVQHEMVLDLGETLPALAAFNAAREGRPRATLFHLVLHALARTLHEKPGLNRFVSGGRFYQRREVALSFAAKKALDEDAPLVTLKQTFPAGDSLADVVERVVGDIGQGRTGPPRAVDKEVSLLTRLPAWALRLVIGLARRLDRWNLMPASMLRTDPLYCSAFLANLGSVGLDRVYHHLFEWGNAHLFCVVGAVRKGVRVIGGEVVVRDLVSLYWTFDERANDGFACMRALGRMAEYIERPGALLALG